MKVKVPGTGTSYGSPEEAFEAAAKLEELRDVEVSDLREQGREAEAERAFDRYGRQIDKTRAAARAAMARDAAATTQPKTRPQRTRRELARRALGSRRRSRGHGGGRRSSLPSLGGLRRGASGRVLRETGIAPATRSVTQVALEAFGLLLAIALLILLLEREQTERPVFSGLVTKLVEGLGVFIGPVDPVSGINVATGKPFRLSDFTAATAPAQPRRRPARQSTTRLNA